MGKHTQTPENHSSTVRDYPSQLLSSAELSGPYGDQVRGYLRRNPHLAAGLDLTVLHKLDIDPEQPQLPSTTLRARLGSVARKLL